MVPIWCQTLRLFFCVASCLQTPNKNLRFLLFFWTTSRKQKLCVFAEVLKAKAGDLYDLDCKQDVSFLVRKSFTPKQQRLKMVISEALLFTGESCPTSFLFLLLWWVCVFRVVFGGEEAICIHLQIQSNSIWLENGPFKDFCSWHWIAIRHFLGRDRCGCSNTCLECWNQCRICTQPYFELCRVSPFWGPGRPRNPKKLLFGVACFSRAGFFRHSQSDDPGFSIWF